MFLPRQLAIQTPKVTTTTRPAPPGVKQRTHDEAPNLSPERPRKRQRSDLPPETTLKPKPAVSAPAELDRIYATEAVKCVEMLLSSYSEDKVHGKWLHARMRDLDGNTDYIHLSALLENPIFSNFNPQPTQKTLLSSLELCPSSRLEISKDKYHMRRKTATQNNPSWDSHTIYAEPNILGISSSPGRLARVVAEATSDRNVEWVEVGNNSWAFITFSEEIGEEDLMEKDKWPVDWIIMTKKEWQQRDKEYQMIRSSRLKATAEPMQQRNYASEQLPVYLKDTKAQPSSYSGKGNAANSDYPRGLIVFLQNTHPESTKSGISTFLVNNVKKYLHKHTSAHSERGAKTVNIDYVDYKPKAGFTSAHLRLKSAEDAQLLVEALQRRRRYMKAGDDEKGKKCKRNNDSWVNAEIIRGERERAYWDTISAGGRKKR
ncbi:hypothetical protein DFH27DRAFT_168682 [Peziza echinospora]|nr:hypothetical protein DFH27DRAFT_168682 [Peziza echinospora]